MAKFAKKILSLEVIAPLIIGVIFLSIWELTVKIMATPPYILPSQIWISLSDVNGEL